MPSETLVVVLDREDGQDQNDFKYKLLQLILQRSGQSYAMGFSTMIQSLDEAVNHAKKVQGTLDAFLKKVPQKTV